MVRAAWHCRLVKALLVRINCLTLVHLDKSPAEHPSKLRTSKWAPFSIRLTRTSVSAWPLIIKVCNGVFLFLSNAFTSQPFSRSAWHTWMFGKWRCSFNELMSSVTELQAKCRRVAPPEVRKFRRTNNCTSFEAESSSRSEERRVGKECRSRWSPYH